jgi:8-oxo-dGTP pyrophosphatase MutT (NUDIX family)
MKNYLDRVKELSKKLPKFPDGRIDYSNSDIAPVVTVFVKYQDEILLLKRSNRVRTYQGKWNAVAGYLDEIKPIKQVVLKELEEETGLGEEEIEKISHGRPYRFKDASINKTWIVHPVIVELKEKPEITLDWEHTDYRWVRMDELSHFDTVPNLVKSLEVVLKDDG